VTRIKQLASKPVLLAKLKIMDTEAQVMAGIYLKLIEKRADADMY